MIVILVASYLAVFIEVTICHCSLMRDIKEKENAPIKSKINVLIAIGANTVK